MIMAMARKPLNTFTPVLKLFKAFILFSPAKKTC